MPVSRPAWLNCARNQPMPRVTKNGKGRLKYEYSTNQRQSVRRHRCTAEHRIPQEGCFLWQRPEFRSASIWNREGELAQGKSLCLRRSAKPDRSRQRCSDEDVLSPAWLLVDELNKLLSEPLAEARNEITVRSAEGVGDYHLGSAVTSLCLRCSTRIAKMNPIFQRALRHCGAWRSSR